MFIRGIELKGFLKNPFLRQGLMIAAAVGMVTLLFPGLLKGLWRTDGFMPHAKCYLRNPQIILLDVSSDLVIGFAYVGISILLGYMVFKASKHIPFHWMFPAFGLFIVTCGFTHLMEVWTVWQPVYWLAGQLGPEGQMSRRGGDSVPYPLSIACKPVAKLKAKPYTPAAIDMTNSTLILPPGYQPLVGTKQTERAIKELKDFFELNLATELNLTRVTAPLFVQSGTGINDDLNGVELPVAFNVRGMPGVRAEIVQSLAKWKRLQLGELGFARGYGLYTDMNAIRPDEILDNTHSLYVDQWDWERVIAAEERTIAFLKKIVRKIYSILKRTEHFIYEQYPAIKPELPEEIIFVHSQELLARYPKLTPRQRENELLKECGAAFIIGIGGRLSDGSIHDGRAPDYDDWSTPGDNGYPGLNGDIFVWNPVLGMAFELSSMGIRVDKGALMRQLEIRNALGRKELYWHQRLLRDEMPLSIGGGIGQSRLCMYYLRKAHVGEIQASMWPADMLRTCREHNIPLL